MVRTVIILRSSGAPVETERERCRLYLSREHPVNEKQLLDA